MGYEFDWTLPFRQPYLGWLLDGIWITVALTLISTVGSLLLGTVLALSRLSRFDLARLLSGAFIEAFRGAPTLFWMLFFFYVLPTLTWERGASLMNRWNGFPFAAAVAALTAANAAHVAEILRAGIQSLPRAQHSAALALGLHPIRVWTSVVMPQAVRVSLPALGSRMVHNFHNTSLALVLGVPELTWQTRQIETTTFRGFEAITIASLAFMAASALMSLGVRRLERQSARWS